MDQPGALSTRRKFWPTAAWPEVRIVAGLRQRSPGRLDLHLHDAPEDPLLADVLASVRDRTQADGWMIVGGEPTLRPDFPRLIQALSSAGAPRLGLVTDGLALTSPKVPDMLGALGLRRVRVHLHSARHDAHDYLTDLKGSWRRAVKAVQVVAEAGLEVEIACTVTRPTAPYLDELVELASRLGARALLLRRVTARGPAADHDVTLLPRFGLISDLIETAVQTGVRRGLRMMLEGFPQCVAPGSAAWLLATDAVVWALPSVGPWPWLGPAVALPPAGPGCARCPGQPVCCQAPVDYTRRFGRAEIDSEGNRKVHPGELPPTPLAGGDTPPPGRSGRFPPMRLSYVRAAAALPSLSGDPLVAIQKTGMSDRIRSLFLAPSRVPVPELGDLPGPIAPESTRDVRNRLVRVAQHGAQTLRLVSAGTLAHPDVGELLREATRLEFRRIEVAGEASALDELGDMELRRLRGIARIDGALFGHTPELHDALLQRPGAFAATLRALDRVASLVPNMATGVYAILRDETDLLAWAEAWDRGDLPGEAAFRLSPVGGDLLRLARAAEQLPAGPIREAIAAVLPRSLFPRGEVLPAPEAEVAWGEIPAQFAKPSGSDRFGCYTDRPSSVDGPKPGGDPGYAVGWTVDGRAPGPQAVRTNTGA